VDRSKLDGQKKSKPKKEQSESIKNPKWGSVRKKGYRKTDKKQKYRLGTEEPVRDLTCGKEKEAGGGKHKKGPTHGGRYKGKKVAKGRMNPLSRDRGQKGVAG